MKRGFVFFVSLAMLLASFTYVRSYSVIVEVSNNHPVHNINTGLNYTTIQEAIDASNTLNGHTIHVDAGLYNESVYVHKSLALIGENPETTIIDSAYTKSFALAVVENANVSGFTMRRADGAGIIITYMNNIVHNNVIELNYGYGIELYEYDSPHYNVIFNNTITGNGFDGIRLGGSHNVLFENFIANNCLRGAESCGLRVIIGSHNRIENNTVSSEAIGIWLEESSNNTLRNNRMYNNTFNFGVEGSNLSHFLHTIDISNRIDERPIYYLVDQSNLVVDPFSCQGIAYLGVVNSNNITVKDVRLTHNSQGLLFAYTNHSLVENITTLNNRCGITLVGSHGNILRNNTIAESEYGVDLSGLGENTIENCNISSNGQCGIILGNSRLNIIRSNSIFNDSFCGIQMYRGAIENIVECNSIRSNCEGILLQEAGGVYVTNNTVRGNIFYNNQIGIEIDSAGNIFYHNNFENNTLHVWFPYVYTPGNVWDNGVEGNYWDKYAVKQDTNSDGIKGSPYSIAANNVDRYPLLGMFSRFNTSLAIYVNVISNSTIEDFEYLQDNNTIKILVSNMTEDQIQGFCRLAITHTVLCPPYDITINDDSVAYRTIFENETLSIIYFAYEHSTLEIIIVPEFPSFLILPLFIIATLLTTIVYGRKHFREDVKHHSVVTRSSM